MPDFRIPLFTLSMTVAFLATPSAAGVTFESDWAAARAASKKTNKPLLVILGSRQCGPCRALDKWVWSNDRVAKYVAEHFVAFYVDRFAQPEHDAVQRYEGRYLVFAEASGDAIFGVTTAPFMTPREAVLWLKRARVRIAERRVLEAEHTKDPKAVAPALALAQRYVENGAYERATKLCDGVLDNVTSDSAEGVTARYWKARAALAGKKVSLGFGGTSATPGDVQTGALLPLLLERDDTRAIDLVLARAPIACPDAARARTQEVREHFAKHPRAGELGLHLARQHMMSLTLDREARRKSRAKARTVLDDLATNGDDATKRGAKAMLRTLDRLADPNAKPVSIEDLRAKELEQIEKEFERRNRAESDGK